MDLNGIWDNIYNTCGDALTYLNDNLDIIAFAIVAIIAIVAALYVVTQTSELVPAHWSEAIPQSTLPAEEPLSNDS